MKRITATFFFLLLSQAVFQESLIIGGAELAFAAEAYSERDTFAVTIENNTSKVTTVMTVFAKDEQDATGQVSLNGWTVIDVKRLGKKEAKSFNLPSDSVNSVMPERVRIKSSLQGGGETSGSMKDGAKGTTTQSAPSAKQEDAAVAADILPSSPELEFIGTYYFGLGNTEPSVRPLNETGLAALDKSRTYVVFGHADEVPVGGNATYGSNYELSFKRAEFIKNIMVRAGIPASSVRTVGLGTGFPAAKSSGGDSPADRRAEIYVFKNNIASGH